MDALNAHDVEAAKRLLSPEFEQRFESSADSWFTNIVSITNIEVGGPVPEVPEGNGMSGYQQGVQVLTHFDLEQRTVVSMHNGATSWGTCSPASLTVTLGSLSVREWGSAGNQPIHLSRMCRRNADRGLHPDPEPAAIGRMM
ncbi:hypothetical protein QV65_03505 [Rhodococcus erythropolis]|nr:hypothetical protein QV65_03505 [Rhodococcus erythropolis]